MERTALAHIAGICGAILLRCGNYPIKDVPQLRSAEAIFEVDLHRSVLKNARFLSGLSRRDVDVLRQDLLPGQFR